MPLDGISARFLAFELNRQLSGARVDRVFQSERTDVVLSLRNGGSNYRLILSSHPDSPRIHLTKLATENPAYPPMFCMLLRKHLIGARVLDISCEHWERVFTLRFQTTDELGDSSAKKLIVEVMGRHSNIILVSDGGTILDAAIHVDDSMSRVREVLPARRYVAPPAQEKRTPEAAFEQLGSDPGKVIQIPSTSRNIELALLETMMGFSPPLCREACFMAGIDGKRSPETLSLEDRQNLGTHMHRLLGRILTEDVHPSVYRRSQEDPVPSDFHALLLSSAGFHEDCATLSEAMDAFYMVRLRSNRLEQRRRKLSQAISAKLAKILRKAEAHRSDIQSCDGHQDLRRFGELILANKFTLDEGIPGFSAVDYASPDEAAVWVPLEANRTLSQNAQRLFRQYAKAKTRLASATRLLLQDDDQIVYLRTLLVALENAGNDTDLDALHTEWESFGRTALDDETEGSASRAASGTAKKASAVTKGKRKTSSKPVKKKAREPAQEPRVYRSSDGFELLVGRNNLQNDRLTFRTADRDDLWMHVQKEPGTHVIIRAEHREIPERTLLEAAETAAWFSRPGGSAAVRIVEGGASAIAVDYCPVRQVRKLSGAKPGMVIYENHRTIRVRPKDPAWLHAPDRSDL